jgi:hypothetical protein
MEKCRERERERSNLKMRNYTGLGNQLKYIEYNSSVHVQLGRNMSLRRPPKRWLRRRDLGEKGRKIPSHFNCGSQVYFGDITT